MSMPAATCDMTENIPPVLGTLDVESRRTLSGVELEVEEVVKLSLL